MATSQISAQARGVVVILQGNAWVVSPDGSKRAIKLGDEIQEGQIVLTEDGTRLELALPNGREISLESGRELLIDANLLGLRSRRCNQCSTQRPQQQSGSHRQSHCFWR